MTLDRDRLVAALPNYEIRRELGRGAWGVVLAAEHRQLGRGVAVKQLPQAFAANPTIQRRFNAEARLLASLDHPHIVPIFDYVEEGGLCLLVMELLPGGTVRDRFATEGFPADTACSIALATCAALHYAHARGILHRDIKPENLLFSASGTLKVTDFGIAKVLGGADTLVTKTGELLGTPAYMAPEQVMATTLTPATDVYAVATMLYELLTGDLPFSDEGGVLTALFRHVYEQPTPLLEVAPTIPPAIAAVVMRSLATDPAERHQSAEDFGVALNDAADASWGPGWLEATDLEVIASKRVGQRISDQPPSAPKAIVRPSGGRAVASTPPVAAEATPEQVTRLADFLGKGSAAPGDVAAPVSPAPTRPGTVPDDGRTTIPTGSLPPRAPTPGTPPAAPPPPAATPPARPKVGPSPAPPVVGPPVAGPPVGPPVAPPFAGPPVGPPVASPFAGPPVGPPVASPFAGPPVGPPVASPFAGPPVGPPVASPFAGPPVGPPVAPPPFAGPPVGPPVAPPFAGPPVGPPVAPPPFAGPPGAPPFGAPSPVPTGRRPTRRRALVVGAVLAAVVLAVVGAFVVFRPSDTSSSAGGGTSATTSGTGLSTTTTVGSTLSPVFSDDFSSSVSGWMPDANQVGNGTAEYRADGYYVTVLKPLPALNTFSLASPYKPTLPAIRVTADATFITGVAGDGAGVRCDQGGRMGLRYSFEIMGDGTWVIFKIDQGNTALLTGTSPAINTSGGRNTITGQCSEVGTGSTKLSMTVNGTALGMVTDGHAAGVIDWHAGLVAYRSATSPATVIRFNSFRTLSVGPG